MPQPTRDEHRALIGLPDKGRRVVSLTKQSTMDTLLYGIDLDNSGGVFFFAFSPLTFHL